MKIADNTVRAVQDYFALQLNNLWDEREVALFFDEVFYHIKGWSRMELRLQLDSRLSESELVKVIHIVKQLKQKKPIQYILGNAPFLRFDLEVNEHTLIPRPETEELVHLVAEKAQLADTVVDVGTGSGCIAIGVKDLLPNARVIGVDVSKEALAVAERNGNTYDLEVEWQFCNILTTPELLPKTRCIVSNPPYIPHVDSSTMEKHVLDYEPHLALFTPGQDDLLFYRALAEYACLNKAELFVEIHVDRGLAVQEVFHTLGGKNSYVKKDLSDRDRMVYATWQD